MAMIGSRRRLALGLGAALGLSRVAHALAAPAGQVEEVRGSVTGEQDSVRRALARADKVFIGEQVLTGDASQAALQLGRDTAVRMGPNARIRIDRFMAAAGGALTLNGGALLLDKAPGSQNAPTRVRGSFGLISVRGTRIFVGPSGGVIGVFVVHGLAEVSASGQTVVLRQGDGTEFRVPGGAPEPVRRWAQPRIDAALATFD